MTRYVLSTLLLIWVLLSFNACNSAEEQDPLLQLETIGFIGTLPEGRTFGTNGILPSHGIIGSSSSVDGSYISHGFSILDSAAEISLMVELPYVKFSDSFNSFQESNDTIRNKAVRDFYPYQIVKEKLSVGDKLILSSQHPDKSKTFRILMVDQKNYLFWTTEQNLDQTGSYIRVKQIFEGQETDPVLGNVKKMEVLFDVDVKLYSSDGSPKQPSKLKGLLRMKYLEK
jgi:hypothetical protein